MYQGQVRSHEDRELVVRRRSESSSTVSRLSRISNEFAIPFPTSRSFETFRRGSHTLIFLSLIAALMAGCGGLTFRGSNSISGSSSTATLAQISCGTQSLVGAQTKSCTADLSATTKTAFQIILKSSNAALKVPASVTVAAGAQSAAFDAVSSSVTKSVAVTISGTAQGISIKTAITLYPPIITNPSLVKVSCGTQSLVGPVTQACSVSLSVAATSPVVVTLKSSSSYLSVPASVTVAAGSSTASFQAKVLAVSSSVTATLTASISGVSVSDSIQLNTPSASSPGTQHVVNLSWNSPASTTDLAGYNVYRSLSGASAFQLLGSTPGTQAAYSDDTVASGESYEYEVKSVSSSGTESAPSNTTTVSIP